MHEIETTANLNEVRPDGFLLDVLVCCLKLVDLTRDIAVLWGGEGEEGRKV